ncbi:hypothetical protein EJB05_21120 [Eragrostis curvula]|uniref:Uncharacterized protein n=1 Tax=Eragrostis curvula TaxID=38414 RepID=A0A5J9V2I5_9POAL|nr:hypothetical protein EJB05_21120 [Eragrostis curvula]
MQSVERNRKAMFLFPKKEGRNIILRSLRLYRRCPSGHPPCIDQHQIEMEASPLPVDVLLQILARSDPSTVVRSCATCKLLRRRVTDPAFLCRLGRGSADQFLLALIYHRHVAFRFPWKKGSRPPVFAPSRSFAGGQPNAVPANMKSQLDGPYNPVASRGGLLVLQSEEGPSRLICVCNPVAGRRHVLPPNKLFGDDLHVVMPEDHGGHDMPFKLLVADMLLRTQTYSSEAGAWGRVTSTRNGMTVFPSYQQVQASQVVLGGVAHWLYHQLTAYLVLPCARLGRRHRTSRMDRGPGRLTPAT